MDDQKPALPPGPDPVQVLLIILALFAALFGQILLYVTPVDDQVVIPWAFWLVLLGAILFIVAQWLRPFPRVREFFARCPIRSWVGWVSVAILLSVAAAVAIDWFERRAMNGYLPVVSFWSLGAVCYLLAFLPVESFRRDWKTWFAGHRRELLWLGMILVVGAILRFYKLGELPRVINGDEGRVGIFAEETITAPHSNPFSLRENIGGFYLQAINAMIVVFGPTAFALRFLPAVGGTLALVTTYLFARQVAGKRVAILAVFLLAVSHTHLHFSRTAAVIYIQGTWLIPLEFYLLLSGLEKRSSWRVALAGIILAVHMSIYISAQIALGVIIVYMLVAFFWLKDSFRPAWRQALVFWGGFLTVFIPEASYMLRQPSEFFSRFNAEGTINSGWLAGEMLLTGKPAFLILCERVVHAFLSLIYYPAYEFYGSFIPIISLVTAVLFILGLGYILVRARSLNLLLLNGYFWGMTFAVGLFAIPPAADSYRMLVALPAVFLIAAIALDQVMVRLGAGIDVRPFQYVTVVSFLLTGLLAYNVWVYFFDFVGQCRYGGDMQTRFASYLGSYVQGVKSEANIYLLGGGVYHVGTHESVDYLTQKRQIFNIEDPLDSLNPVSGETLIASPERIGELHSWARGHPGGQLNFFYDCQKAIMLVYQVP